MSLFLPRKCYMGCVFFTDQDVVLCPLPRILPLPRRLLPLVRAWPDGPQQPDVLRAAPGTRPKRWPEFPAAQARIQQPEGVQRFRNFWRFQQKSFEVEKFQSNGKKKFTTAFLEIEVQHFSGRLKIEKEHALQLCFVQVFVNVFTGSRYLGHICRFAFTQLLLNISHI